MLNNIHSAMPQASLIASYTLKCTADHTNTLSFGHYLYKTVHFLIQRKILGVFIHYILLMIHNEKR